MNCRYKFTVVQKYKNLRKKYNVRYKTYKYLHILAIYYFDTAIKLYTYRHTRQLLCC